MLLWKKGLLAGGFFTTCLGTFFLKTRKSVSVGMTLFLKMCSATAAAVIDTCNNNTSSASDIAEGWRLQPVSVFEARTSDLFRKWVRIAAFNSRSVGDVSLLMRIVRHFLFFHFCRHRALCTTVFSSVRISSRRRLVLSTLYTFLSVLIFF